MMFNNAAVGAAATLPQIINSRLQSHQLRPGASQRRGQGVRGIASCDGHGSVSRARTGARRRSGGFKKISKQGCGARQRFFRNPPRPQRSSQSAKGGTAVPIFQPFASIRYSILKIIRLLCGEDNQPSSPAEPLPQCW